MSSYESTFYNKLFISAPKSCVSRAFGHKCHEHEEELKRMSERNANKKEEMNKMFGILQLNCYFLILF